MFRVKVFLRNRFDQQAAGVRLDLKYFYNIPNNLTVVVNILVAAFFTKLEKYDMRTK